MPFRLSLLEGDTIHHVVHKWHPKNKNKHKHKTTADYQNNIKYAIECNKTKGLIHSSTSACLGFTFFFELKTAFVEKKITVAIKISEMNFKNSKHIYFRVMFFIQQEVIIHDYWLMTHNNSNGCTEWTTILNNILNAKFIKLHGRIIIEFHSMWKCFSN